MLTIRPSIERGTTQLNWLHSKHSFSFGDYYDSEHRNFGALRVINEDFIQPESGFGTHSHNNMEIISYVLEGGLEHKDSLGNGSIIVPGEVQRMTAGSGIQHSEFNPSKNEKVHLLQIWITPHTRNLVPSYEQKSFKNSLNNQPLTLVASADGREGSIVIYQDAFMYVLNLSPQEHFTYEIKNNRIIWLQVVRGKVTVNEHEMTQGDGAGVVQEQQLRFLAAEKTEVLLFNLPAVN